MIDILEHIKVEERIERASSIWKKAGGENYKKKKQRLCIYLIR